MVRFGIIGTSAITEKFLEAASLCKDFQLNAVYSRTLSKGKEFAERYEVKNVFDNMDEMIDSGLIDAVYIASPNSLHFEQSKKFLEKNIGVLCEKPLASNSREVQELIELSKINSTLLMEGIRTIHNPNFKIIVKNLERIGLIRGVYASYCQYSSRYDKFKQGEILNAFKLELSNGSTMDIGLYPFYFVVSLFGEPQAIQSSGTLLSTGVDGAGSAILTYPNFTACVAHSKINDSYIPSEIMGEKGSIIIEKLSLLEKITLKLKDGTCETLSINSIENDMYYEIQEFVDCYKNKVTESSQNPHENILSVSKTMEKSRKQLGVYFPADSI